MKRLFIAIFIMISIIAVTIVSAYDFYSIKTYLEENLAIIEGYIYQNRLIEASNLAEEILNTWNNDEKHTLRYLNHHDIDTATALLARLPQMILYENAQGEALGDINHLKMHLQHVWESELPYLRNLL